MNTVRIMQIWLAVGLIGILLYFYSSSFASPGNITRYSQLCLTGKQHSQLQLEMREQCKLQNTSILVSIIGPDTGIIIALSGFYIALMAEVNLIYEKKERIRS
ncbi:MAG: hypothetical protein WB988_21845 [Candidatus Nitrosopolaris sp.]